MGPNLLKLADVQTFKEILRKLCRHSPVIRIEKTKKQLVLSSISTDELSLASAVLKLPFFNEWNERTENTIDVGSKTLGNIAKVIQKESQVAVDVSNKRLHFEINDVLTKRMIVTGVVNEQEIFHGFEIEEPNINLRIDSKILGHIVKELSSLLDETKLLLRKDKREIVFSGKQRELNLEIISQDFDMTKNVEDDISVEFPVSFLKHFTPLMHYFKDMSMGFSMGSPLVIEGNSEKWKLVLMVSKISKAL